MGIALLFLVSFVASRLILRVDLHLALIHRVAGVGGAGTSRGLAGLTLALMLATVLMSAVVPNAISILAMLPVVMVLTESIARDRPELRDDVLTLLGLSIIFAANIGGMGSMTGSPANGLMMLALAHAGELDRLGLDFFSWLLWGIPLALSLTVVAWAVLMLGHRRLLGQLRGALDGVELPEVAYRRDLAVGLRWLGLALVGAIALGIWRERVAQGPPLLLGLDAVALAQLGATAAWVSGLFLAKLPERKGPALRLHDLWAGLPWRGVVFGVIIVVVALVALRLGAVEAAITWIAGHFPADPGQTAAIFLCVGVTVLATEVFSNSATSLAMWAVALGMAQSGGWAPGPVIVGVALASTAAFMSPFATPSTALGIGALRGLKLRRLLTLGAALNLLAWAIVSAAAAWFIPWMMGW